MVDCQYCGDHLKPRGYRNHVRMSGGDHGDVGDVPEDFAGVDGPDEQDADGDGGEDAEQDGEDASDMPDAEVTDVDPDELVSSPDDANSGPDGDDGEDLPFDPDDPDVIALDGGEVMDIRKDGEVYPGVEADAGDYLIQTDRGPVLYDSKNDEMLEVVTL